MHSSKPGEVLLEWLFTCDQASQIAAGIETTALLETAKLLAEAEAANHPE